jgi:hypothetical protein
MFASLPETSRSDQPLMEGLLGRMRTATVLAALFAIWAVGLVLEPAAFAQSGGLARPLITQQIVETSLVRLLGNVRPEVNASNDRGRVPDTLPMEHMFLQLQRPAAQEQALKQLIEELHDPRSPNFHQWLTPSQFGTQFGPAAADIGRITAWLRGHGFTVNVVYPSGMTIDFSGTAGQVFTAFHTEIHYVEARGATHFANTSDPQIPAALAPAVVGVVSLNNFVPRPRLRLAKPQYTLLGGNYAVTPADLATIYNFNPVFNSGNTGQNQTIYLIEDTDLYSTNDWTTFRSAFGLSGYTGASLNTVHPAPPSGPNNCSDPGVNSDDGEAILDAEYASAAAPSAAIVMATCANSPDGLLIAIQNLVNSASPPAIISMSYGECEASNGASSNAAYSAIFQQGVAEGTSIFVSAGDEGAGSCDDNGGQAVTHGIGVSGLASTPYNVAVGGTDFSDTYSGTNSTYWNSSNTSTYGSALSYVPEIPWNGSCASQLFATFFGYTTTYGSTGFCNGGTGEADFLDNAAGSGGPSGCATGAPSIAGVVSGTCEGYAKPSWQSGVLGNPNDGVRDLPDVSLFASNGWWGHYYIFCWSDPAETAQGSAPCTGAPSSWSGAGGTSFASPIMAGIQALVNQQVGGPQGNPNYRLYQLAAQEYGVSGSSTCNASNGNTVGSSCIFYDVTLGDNDAPCTGTYDCYLPSGTYGVLSTSDTAYAPAYGDDGLGLRHRHRHRQRLQSGDELERHRACADPAGLARVQFRRRGAARRSVFATLDHLYTERQQWQRRLRNIRNPDLAHPVFCDLRHGRRGDAGAVHPHCEYKCKQPRREYLYRNDHFHQQGHRAGHPVPIGDAHRQSTADASHPCFEYRRRRNARRPVLAVVVQLHAPRNDRQRRLHDHQHPELAHCLVEIGHGHHVGKNHHLHGEREREKPRAP